MSEPVYTAKTWRDSAGGWRWQTFKDGADITRRGSAVGIRFGVTSRAEAIARARLDMEWNRDCGVEEIRLHPKAAETTDERAERTPGLYVVMTNPPGPDSEFVELENQDGRGVGPVQSGAEWRQEGLYWTLGPFGPARSGEYIVIYPREGVSATQVKDWLEENFQKPGSVDGTLPQSVVIRGGTPLVNAHIEVAS